MVVVDESGSMESKLVVRDDPSALQRLRQDLGEATKKLNRCDEIAALAVAGHPSNESENPSKDNQVRLIQPTTTDHALALRRITDQVPYGQTALYDGITQGLQLIESAHYPNRAMIVVTDGLDNTSDTRLDEALNRAKQDSVPISM